MSRTLRTVLSVAVVAVLVPATLSAQDPEEKPLPPTKTETEATVAEAALAAVTATPSALEALATRADLAAEDVRVVVVDMEDAGEQAAALDDAIAEQQEAIATVREGVAANEAISTALVEQQATVDQVIGLQVPAEGQAVVYVLKESDA